MKHVGVRLSADEYKFLAARAEKFGQSVSAVIRSLIHSVSLVESVERAIARSHDSLFSKLSTPPAGEPVTRAAIAALIEHDALPRAPMDRKPQLLAALKALKS